MSRYSLLADLCADWCEHGAEAVRRVREDRPSDYLKLIALIVAKGDMTVNVTHFQDVEQFIEERRQKALLAISRMREEPIPEESQNRQLARKNAN